MRKVFHKTLIGMGANVGNRVATCCAAIDRLRNHPEIEKVRPSPFYETAPFGVTDQAPFINLVIEMYTTLSPFKLLRMLKSMEKELGRVRRFHWGPREIDLDILLYETEIITSDTLEVPHPGMHERAFVLVPACDIAGDWIHPVLNRPLHDLLASLSRKGVAPYQGPIPCA